jgi:hypothetical protein
MTTNKHLNIHSLLKHGVNLIKLFFLIFIHAFVKLGHFINVDNISLSCQKIWLLKRVRKFTSKKFHVIDSRGSIHNIYFLCKLLIAHIS